MNIQLNINIARKDFSLKLELSLPNRGVTAIFGPSGCGKTTLLRAIAGLEKNPEGIIKIGERVWQEQNLFLKPHERSVGYVFQGFSLFTHMSVKQNIEYGLRWNKSTQSNGYIPQLVKILELEGLLNRAPLELSGGEQQRVAIARALAINPSVLLLDEPLTGLDDKLKVEILGYLESLHREIHTPILYITHSKAEVARLADEMVYLEAGRVKAQGTPSELFSRLDLPMAHESNAESVIEAEVKGYDENFGLLSLGFSGGEFKVASKAIPSGTKVRVQVLARDVSITLKPGEGTSILNILPVTVAEIVEDGNTQVLVKLSAGQASFLSRITRKSVSELGLKPGQRVYAQVKSVAILF